MSPEAYLQRKSAARANRAFYDALERLDLDALRVCWLDDPSVKCVHPGGELIVGPERVLESWRRIFENAARLSHTPSQEGLVAIKEEVRRLF